MSRSLRVVAATPGAAAGRVTTIGGLPCPFILALTVAGGIAALITATAAPALAIYPVQTTT